MDNDSSIFPGAPSSGRATAGSIRPERLRSLDRWFGVPLCALLTLTRALGRVFCRQSQGEPPVKRILFVKWVEQGATVLAYDAIRRAAELVGRDNVFFCVFEDNRGILDLLDVVPSENVLAIRTHSLRSVPVGAVRAIRKARKLGIDCVVDMELFARGPAVFTYLTGARRRVGLHRFTSEGPYRGDLMTHRVQYNPYSHMATTYRTLVEALLADPRDIPLVKSVPVPVSDPPPRFLPSDEEPARVQGLLDELAGREVRRPIVILNANTSDIIPLRKWPVERFIELGRLLLSHNPNLTLLLTGAPSEESAVTEVARRMETDRVINLAGKTTLRELVVLYTLCDVLVTNDSGPSHFASITDIDIVTLFGPETPALYGPLGRRSHVIWKGLACSPCVSALNHRLSPCRNNACMQAITVEEVFSKVRELLDARAGGQVTVDDG